VIRGRWDLKALKAGVGRRPCRAVAYVIAAGIFSLFKVVNIAEAEPTGTEPDTAYSAGTRSLI
jgi:hypothetical protein